MTEPQNPVIFVDPMRAFYCPHCGYVARVDVYIMLDWSMQPLSELSDHCPGCRNIVYDWLDTEPTCDDQEDF